MRRTDGETSEGWEEACAGLPLSHMGRGPDDDPSFFAPPSPPVSLARRLLRLMEERRLGPSSGSAPGTRSTATSRSRARSSARRSTPACRCFDTSPMYGGAERSLGARARGPPRRGDRADEDLDAVGRRGAPRSTTPSSPGSAGSRSSRSTTSSPGRSTCRGSRRAGRGADRPDRRHPLRAVGVRRARAGAAHRALRDAAGAAQPARARRASGCCCRSPRSSASRSS